ncbi:MAG: lactate utilization protein, partial [Planctomycetales bacterium]|nr:lactate utilization protein [Planctomycetales bacterium]
LHIACMGIEKLIPRAADLGVFLRLLARSATGQPITTYSSHFHGPNPGSELHIVLVDNGRSEIVGQNDYRKSLNCIRCGACMNTCPVYRRSGGHSYNATVPGPIGSILNPVTDAEQHSSLPFACSLCGSCSDVCPVKIDLHHQLLILRRDIFRKHLLPLSKRIPMKLTSWLFQRSRMFEIAGRLGRRLGRWTPRFLMYNRFNGWGKQRELPIIPLQSFREMYRDEAKSRQANESRGESK